MARVDESMEPGLFYVDDNTVYVILGEPEAAEPFIAKVFAEEASAVAFASKQNAKQLAIAYSVHPRWVEMDDAEYPSE